MIDSTLPFEPPMFVVATPLGFTVRTTERYWHIITTIKHPIVLGKEEEIKLTLQQPDEVRQSKSDPNVYLFYRSDGENHWLCAVVKRLNGDGFLVTAYRSRNIKEGNQIWPL